MDRLTMDSIAAEKAGMSYGKWKALHPHTEVEIPEEPITKPCRNCGKQIPRSYKGKLYCGVDCAHQARLARGREFYARNLKRSVTDDGQV